jgi:hypothetical protein
MAGDMEIAMGIDPLMEARRVDGKCPACGKGRGEGCDRPNGCYLLGAPETTEAYDPTLLKRSTVQYCPICRTKTWHVDGVCEWLDGHVVMGWKPHDE